MPVPAVLRTQPFPVRAAPSAPGAPPAVNELYALYGARVFRRARSLLRDPDRARDATQEVFLRAVQDPGRFGAHPLPWLYRVTRNLCLNSLRDNRRRGQLLARRAGAQLGDGGTDARVAVTQLFARLPAELQEIVAYYYLDDLSHEAIAAIVGVSRRTIGNRLAAFQAFVDELLREEGNA